MTWAALLGIALQLVINCELGRYTLATGESAYTGFARLSRFWGPLFILLNVVGWILPGWARSCGGALKALLVGPAGWGAPWMWTAITFAGVALVLFGPRLVYHSVEVTTEALVVIMTLGLIAIALWIGEVGTWRTLAAGAVNVPYRDPGMPVYELFSSIVFAGAGGTANLFYCLYIRDKGWGMAAHAPHVLNPLRGRAERAANGGRIPTPTAANRTRWRSWFRHLIVDQVVFFWGLNTLTILLFIYAALAVLHPRGAVPDQEMLVWDEAVMLGALAGSAGRVVFLAVGVACLFSTQLTLVDGVARSLADIVHTNYAWARRRSLGWWYGLVAALWILLGIVLTYLYEQIPTILFLLSAGFFGGIAMAIYAPLTLLMNRRLLPAFCRPGRAASGLLALVSLFYVAFAVAAVLHLAGLLE